LNHERMTQQNLSPAWCRVFFVYERPLLAQSGRSLVAVPNT